MTQAIAAQASSETTQTAQPGASAPQYSADSYVPPAAWGKDHWATLAYVDSVMTDCGGFQVGADARMRAGRRNHRVMAQGCPNPKRAGNTRGMAGPAFAVVSAAASRLATGQELAGHDDWSCVQDMAAANLFTTGAESVEPGNILQFSEKGKVWMQALRSHKQQGGNFAAFRAEGLPEMPECEPPVTETFHFMGCEVDVTGIRTDIASGRIRPKKTDLSRENIEMFARSLHGLDKSKPQSTDTSMFSGVRAVDVHQVPDAVLDEPVLFVYIGKGRGIVNLGDGADYVLADGNKRLGKAFFNDRQSISALVLSPTQSRQYRS